MKTMNNERRPLTKLLQARLQRHWSQRDLADQLDTSFVTISRWERGLVMPGSYYRQRLCELFEMSLEELGLEVALAEPLPSLAAASSPPGEEDTLLWSVPYRRNPFFTGRQTLLEQLHTILKQQQSALVSQSAALSGLGGIGKTQLALEYAYRYMEEYSAIFWVNAETAESLFSSFLGLADLLRLPERLEPEQRRIVTAVLRWLSNRQDWLLIFDNVENVELLKDFLPPVPRGALLLTSRKQAFDVTAHLLRLETLSQEEGLRLLLRRARWDNTHDTLLTPEEEAAARQIVREMDGLPLALDQAGAYLEVTRCRPSDYLKLLQTVPLPLLTERESHAEHPLSVTRTFQLAFQQVETLNPEASELLSVCAFLAPEAIPESFLLDGASTLGQTFESLLHHPLRFHAALKSLLSYSLAQRNPSARTITVHRLVQAVLRAELAPEARQHWSTRVLATMTRLLPANDLIPDYWQRCEPLLPHALTIINTPDRSNQEEEEVLLLMSNAATYLSKRSRYSEAQPLFEQVRQRAEQSFGSQHGLVARALHGLASIQFDEGNYARARELFEQAVSLYETDLPASNPLLATSLHSLGILFCMQGNYEAGSTLFHRALTLFEQAQGPEDPTAAHVLNSLANIACKQEDFLLAESLYRRSLHLLEQSLGSYHPHVAQGLNNLANLAMDQGQYEQAIPLFERAISLLEQTLGPEHPRLAFPLAGLAEVLVEQGSYEQAGPYCQRALTIWQATLGPEHPMVGCVLLLLATIYCEQGQYVEAEPLYQQSLDILEQTGHVELVRALTGFAHLREIQQQPAEAVTLYARALPLRENMLGVDHPKTQQLRERIAALR